MNMKKQEWIIIQEELENRILYGLSCEWKLALSIANLPKRDLMQMPLFSIKDMKGKWGYWCKERREISLSRNLILNHSWDSVREILIHEMAHQYTDMILFARDEPPHGPSFHNACHILRANPKASGSYPPLDERVSNKTLNLEDKILIKVKKLLALAKSHNKNEAEAAMTKAHEFMARYNLDPFAPGKSRNFGSIFLGKPALRHSRADYLLANILNDFYFVQGIWVSAYVLVKGKMGRVLEINGTIRNIQIAFYIYDYIQNFIKSQWSYYIKDKELNHHGKTDFAVGILEGFRSKITSQEKEEKGPVMSRSLIETEDPLFVNYLHYRYPRISTFNKSIYTRDEKLVNDGKRIGKGLIISEGVTEKKESQRFLPGN
ncbi:MAG: SprT-like domain-containing protein [bacterium]